VIYGTRLGCAILFLALAYGWIIGCGPKPVALIVEPPQPKELTAVIASDATVETDRQKKGLSGLVADSPQGTTGSTPTTDASIATEVDDPPLVHKVQWGHETLYTIARWYTGKSSNWRRLAAANPKIKPRRMQIGDKVRIPGPLLNTRRPMPPDYLKPSVIRKPRPAKKKPSKPKPVEKVQTPPIQGPVDQTPALYGPVGDTQQAPVEEKNQLSVPLETIDE